MPIETNHQITVSAGRSVASTPGTVRLEFPIHLGDESSHTLWFEVPEWAAADPSIVDAAALVALLPAMRTGRALLVRGTMSAALRTNLIELMAATSMWFPEFTPVRIDAEQTDDGPPDHTRLPTGLFFSGGVDSFHSLRTAPHEISHIIHVDALDTDSRDAGLHARIGSMLSDVAERTPVGLIRVRTNMRGLLDPFAQWGPHAHALALGAVGHALSGGLATVLLAADRTYADLKPYGVHPATTPLYGSHRLATSSHGWGSYRVDKVAQIADWDVAMDHLRVCWRNPDGAYNCGVCEKCIRTVVALELAGAAGRCATLGDLPDLETIATIEYTGSTLDYAVPALHRAREGDRHRDLAAALQRSIDSARSRAAVERLERDWPLAARDDVSTFVGTHRESLYRVLSAYQGRWLVRRILGSLPRRLAARFRRRRRRG